MGHIVRTVRRPIVTTRYRKNLSVSA